MFSLCDRKFSDKTFRVLQEQPLLNPNSMEKTGRVDLPLPTPENDVPNEVCANATFFWKMENKIQNRKTVRRFDKSKVYANFVFQVVFQN